MGSSPSVFDEAQLLEFVQEEVHARTRRADHLGERVLGDLRDHADRYGLLPVARQQQQRARQPFLAGVEELIDQVLFDSDVAGQHVRDESVGHGALPVQQLRHLSLADAQDRARRDRRRASHAKRLTRQAPLAEEVPGAEHRHNRLFAGL